jgi:hypothetical protein
MRNNLFNEMEIERTEIIMFAIKIKMKELDFFFIIHMKLGLQYSTLRNNINLLSGDERWSDTFAYQKLVLFV